MRSGTLDHPSLRISSVDEFDGLRGGRFLVLLWGGLIEGRESGEISKRGMAGGSCKVSVLSDVS